MRSNDASTKAKASSKSSRSTSSFARASHGDDARYHHVMLGLNYRVMDIAAVIGLN